jgi:DNA-directed RNA polymerase specialized sigma24 family protein
VVAWFEGQRAKYRWKKDPSIGPTHIVDALWERLHARDRAYESGRRYMFKAFYTECARIFLDHRKRTWRHHGGRVDLPTHILAPGQSEEVFEKLDAALAKLRAVDKLDADIGAMRVLESVEDESRPGATRGLRNDEVAERLDVSKSTVEHRWKHIKAFLISELEGS